MAALVGPVVVGTVVTGIWPLGKVVAPGPSCGLVAPGTLLMTCGNCGSTSSKILVEWAMQKVVAKKKRQIVALELSKLQRRKFLVIFLKTGMC